MRTISKALAAALTLSVALSACSESTAPTATPATATADSPTLALTAVQGTGQATGFRSQMATDKCIDIPGGSTAPGTQVTIYTCQSGAASQTFSWQSTGEIKYGSNMCLDAGGGAGRDGDPIIVYTCHGGTNQKWSASAAGEIKGINGKCLDIGGWSNTNGAKLQLYTCHAGANQKWTEVTSGTAAAPAPAPAPAPVQSAPATSAPSGAIAIQPGESIQSKVNAYPTGTSFLLKAGTHSRQTVVPKSGDSFYGEAGTIMDGGGSQYAFWAGSSSPYPGNVRIQGITITNYNAGDHFGAIRVSDHLPQNGGADWTIEACEIRYNATGGIRVGTRTRVLRNNIHHNGMIGVTGAGAGILVEGNEIAYNNYQDKYDWTWNTGGGSKFVETTDLIVRNNFSHHNRGPGFWSDLNNIRTTYEGNRIEDNADAGIFHEISYAAVVRNNSILRNGKVSGRWIYGAGIVISASPDVEIYGNTLSENYAGIVGIQQVRNETALYGPHILQNLYVHNNTVTMQSGVSGIGQGGMSDWQSYFTSRNNRFVSNTWNVGGNGYPFTWMNENMSLSRFTSFGQS